MDRQEVQIAVRRREYPSVWEPLLAFTKNQWLRITLISSAVILAIGSIYFYNLMLVTEQNMDAAYANVNALLERRHDLSANLSKAVLDYTDHERTLLTSIVSMRSDMTRHITDTSPVVPPAVSQTAQPPEAHAENPAVSVGDAKAPPTAKTETAAAEHSTHPGNTADHPAELKRSASELSPFAGLLAVAEHHPDLKSNGPFQAMMTGLIDVEKDLATARLQYNDMANVYTSTIGRFPVNIFAKIFRFQPAPYYTASTEARQFKPIDF